MSKFVLLFAVICLLATVCYAEEAKRVRRDATEDAKKAMESFGDTVKGLFTEESMNNFLNAAKDFGSKMKAVADDVVAKVSEKPAAPAS